MTWLLLARQFFLTRSWRKEQSGTLKRNARPLNQYRFPRLNKGKSDTNSEPHFIKVLTVGFKKVTFFFHILCREHAPIFNQSHKLFFVPHILFEYIFLIFITLFLTNLISYYHKRLKIFFLEFSSNFLLIKIKLMDSDARVHKTFIVNTYKYKTRAQ